MYEPSKGTGFIDIQEGDAISESSDTEVVAHTNEQIHYDGQASSGSNSEDNVNDGPPPLNSDEDDEDDDDDDVYRPPPIESDDNAENTDDGKDLPTSPDTGSAEELNTRRTAVPSKRRGAKDSEDSDSESDSEVGVKEVPPPLDSEDDDEEEMEASNSGVENVMSHVGETTKDYLHDSPVEDIDNDDDRECDNDDVEEPENDDDEEKKEHNYDDSSGDNEHGIGIDNNEEGRENVQTTQHFSKAFTHEAQNSDGSEQSDSSVEAEGEIRKQQRYTEEEEEEEEEAVKESDNSAALETLAEADVMPVTHAEVSSDILSDENSQDDEQKDDKETEVKKDAASVKLIEKQTTVGPDGIKTVSVRKEESDVDSDQDSQESPEFVPDDEENELEWDVEDFDLPKHKSTNRTKATPKMDSEGAEVDKLKASFLDTLRSEAEHTKAVESGQKAESRKKEKPSKGLNTKIAQAKEEEKKQVKDYSRNVTVQELKSVPGSARRAIKDTAPKTEQVKVEKKIVKDGPPKSAAKNVAPSKPVENITKPVKSKPKNTDSSLEKADKQKTEKQRRDVKESPRVTEASERKATAKSAKVKSASASSLPSGANELQRGQSVSSAKDKKKPRPTSHTRADLHSHKEETGQKRREESKVQKNDSHASLDSLTRQKPQKTISSESVSKPKKSNAAVSTSHKEKERAIERAEIKQSKTKRTAAKSAATATDHNDGHNHENKRRGDVHAKNVVEPKSKPKGRPSSNGHLSSSQEKLSLHSGRHDHSARDQDVHRHGGHAHERGKHVWLCRDDEIHKLIAQKASLLKEYETGSLAGRKVCK